MNGAIEAEAHVRLAPEEFFWAMLRVEGIHARKLESAATRALLDEAFAAHLPVALDRVATAYLRLPTPGESTIIACGLALDRLHTPEMHRAITISPTSFPAWIPGVASDDGDPSCLNILSGAWEPEPVRSARCRLSLLRAGVAACIGIAIAFGFWRTANYAHAQTRVADAAFAVTLAAAPGSISAHSDPTFAASRELARLRATRPDAGAVGVVDASAELESVLRAWPKNVDTKVSLLSVNSRGVQIEAVVPGNTHAAEFAAAFKRPDDTPPVAEIVAQGDASRVRLRLDLSATPQTRSARSQD